METFQLSIHVKSLADATGDFTNLLNDHNGERYLENDYPELTFKISYPLENPVELKIINPTCIADILVPIAQKYKEIYEEEKQSALIPVLPGNGRVEKYGLLNRNKTYGKYGIWGHDLGDLFFEGITINDDGTKTDLCIGS